MSSKKKKVTIQITINKITSTNETEEFVFIKWKTGKNKKGIIEDIQMNRNIRKDISLTTTLKKVSESRYQTKGICLKIKKEKKVLVQFKIDISQVFKFKNQIGGFETKEKNKKGEEYIISYIISTQIINPNSNISKGVNSPIKDANSPIIKTVEKEDEQNFILPSDNTQNTSKIKPSTSIKKPVRNTFDAEKSKISRKRYSMRDITTEQPIATRNSCLIAKPFYLFDEETIKIINEITSMDNYREFMFKTSKEFADHFITGTEQSKIIFEIKEELSKFTLLSCVLFSLIVQKNNDVLFKECINQFLSNDYSFLETQYVFISFFETIILLNAKNQSKRVEMWRECTEFCTSKTCLIADKLMDKLMKSYQFEPKSNYQEIMNEVHKLRFPDSLKNLLEHISLYALDVKLYKSYLNKLYLSTNDGNILLSTIFSYDYSFQEMPLCLELSKLLMLDDPQILKDEDIRLRLCPHIPLDDIKTFLYLNISPQRPLFTKSSIDTVIREIQQQRFLSYSFIPPFFKQEQIKEYLKTSSIKGVLTFSFKSTPFADKLYL
ncbi:hypothetical protein EHI8A_008280 [Entamoeba histolytica HM-1:IMSS-B]|uniref:Dilute domain-containing protein n=6 Tax=Entamoeba histolytica TaxID=5759 RepID=C4M1A0_ENTH1|nr:hypothetical protein EHI_188260 [Entamoeba histolytica HM-1:IMSS]EMD49255.1 Hypothetical protein EHI5A_003650 [Entamoeba histolytica KU27]EMH72238.1 hypothetical protein EHI8A_008280 [Entamoeba histolytica HM-1:IMSS-B]EMS12167.1 hypothetical protein KM1_022550 [Entamoeba histolytica HM-3:IMSS]ENY59996.1 hypothetical protein EHI7A_111120 [Entamoeba histolytica HM-1:IMSS-A]GAT94976.1 hypothetical protein CL6EHI_188260 [Entamoeba histolytica]|eukprot:XP_653694.1 hypothetical protein EHI_188260 [Entamoeba histolytica HM-1:IMSS]